MSLFQELYIQYHSSSNRSKDMIASFGSSLDSGKITEAFREIANLERKKDELEPWDGDGSDEIGLFQSFISDVLAAVPRELLTIVANGLKHESRDVRCCVSSALSKRNDASVLNELKAALELEADQLARIILTKTILELDSGPGRS